MATIWILIVLHTILSAYLSRFVRIFTGNNEYQLALIPNWMGVLSWIITGLGCLILVLLFFQASWVWASVYILWTLFGVSIIAAFSPLPTYNHCYHIIAQSLRADRKNRSESLQLYAMLEDQITERLSTR